jgi:hypothetical protein
VNPDWHPSDLLSGFLDGELPDDVAEQVEVHCLLCSACALELDAARFARRDLRHLPAIEPPPGFLDALLAPASRLSRPPERAPQRTRWWLGNAAVAVTVGLVLVVAGTGGTDGVAAASMTVGEAVEQHVAIASAMSDAADAPFVAPPRVTELDRPYLAPTELAGYRLVDAYEVHGGVQLLYERGADGLSVFQVRGSARRSSAVIGGFPVEVVDHDGLTLTIVGDGPGAPVAAAVEQLDDERSRPSRLRRACGDVLEVLSPAG